MEFWADLRLSTYGGMPEAHKVQAGGLGWGHPEVPAHQVAVCHELIHDYQVDGVELDFTADQNAFAAAQLADGTAAAVLDAFLDAEDLTLARSGGLARSWLGRVFLDELPTRSLTIPTTHLLPRLFVQLLRPVHRRSVKRQSDAIP